MARKPVGLERVALQADVPFTGGVIDAAVPNAFSNQTAGGRDRNHYDLVMYDMVFRIGRRRAADGAALAGL